jgi:DNA repair photolyase
LARSTWNPQSPFHSTTVEWDGPPPDTRLQVLVDDTRTILSENRSPDVPFRWGINPYRGCTHACAYCYARRHHEFLGFGAGTDFETRVLVKLRAPELLEQAFRRPGWVGERVAFSGATDCYQPLERRYTLTRRCLEVCVRYRNPVGIITRSPLITRDIDLLVQLARLNALSVAISLPILDPKLCQAIEPGAPLPKSRLAAIRALTDAGISVGINVAPVIPGLNDRQIPAILQAAREAGAQHAWMGLVRLSGNVAHVFTERLTQALGADHTASILRRIHEARGGSLDGIAFGDRMEGKGPAWAATDRLFSVWHARLGFTERAESPEPSPFRIPGTGRQVGLGW